MDNKLYSRSRKAVFLFMILIFLISVASFKVRSMQRDRNFNDIHFVSSDGINYSRIQNIIEIDSRKSRNEDILFFALTNIITFILFISLDNFGLFEKTSETYHKNKKWIKGRFMK